jgi:predicted acylesterase/phospholipase RssA
MSGDSAHLDSMRDAAAYKDPVRYCDIVMKGGITSGVIYPHAVCELARTYQLRSIGGASAGAIAAVAAAAAEYGRHSPSGGFARLAELPEWMGESSNLYDLFQPQEGTRRLYRLFTAPIGVQGGRITRLLVTALEQFFRWALLGVAPGIVMLMLGLSLAHGTARGIWIGAAIPLMLLGVFIGVIFGIYRIAGREIPANRFGLCSGMPGPKADVPSLTPWLDQLIEELAGRGVHGRTPLTFGDLWLGRDKVGKPIGDKTGDPCIRLEMMTTNLTQGRPYRLPFEDKQARQWYFDPREFRKLFPERIVRWMEQHPPALTLYEDQEWTELERKLLYPLQPFPDRADVPVVVAARMSLSFPMLMSAVPLWAVDWARTANRKAKRQWQPWTGPSHLETRYRPDSIAWDNLVKTVGPAPNASPHWFSDGGITSNFPVHFFDAPIPRWPTFAINLRDYHPDHLPTCNRCDDGACDEQQSIWMPDSNTGGILEGTRAFAPKGLAALVGFGHAIIDTMQNWTDNAQTRVPGYRDRVAHVYHSKEEGGMNLSMPRCRIEALAERGRCAAERLVEHFSLPADPKTKVTWDNHRWVRYRTTMALLQETISRFEGAWVGKALPEFPLYPPPGERTFQSILANGAKHAPSYQLEGLQPFAQAATQLLLDLAGRWQGGDLGEGAPSPRPEFKVRPRI